MPGELDGKVAFVTGAARGQGRAHALRLAQAGCDIVAVDICAQIDGVEYPMSVPADLAETAKLVEALGGRVVTGIADVRDASALRAVHEDGLAEFGRLDFVIANAGVMPIFGAASNTVAIWQLCLDVLLTGVLHTLETTYPQLVDQGDGGSIVITGSMAALQPMMRTEGRHTYGMLGYAAAKAALCNLSRWREHTHGCQRYGVELLRSGATRRGQYERPRNPGSTARARRCRECRAVAVF
jgi:NAD(P)-dependent dehydrogenase (short-subunit alcohol dehydrogenase family)